MVTRKRAIFLNQPPSSGGGSVSGGNISIGGNYGDGTPTMTMSIGTVSFVATATQVLCSKDCWVDNTASCIGTTNHDGEDLQFDGILASNKSSYVGWDLSSYPTGTTVSSASLDIEWKPGLLHTASDVDIHQISNANETWNETTIDCSTRPASAGTMQTFQWTPSAVGVGVSQTVTLNSTVRSRIAARMGVGNFTMLFILGSLNLLTREAESKDEGTNNNLGMRLTFTYSKTL